MLLTQPSFLIQTSAGYPRIWVCFLASTIVKLSGPPSARHQLLSHRVRQSAQPAYKELCKMPRSIPWMAPNGGKQGKPSDASKRKRSSDVIDLTGDSAETRPAPKTPRTSSTRTPSHSQSSAGPSSSAARSRQYGRTPSWTQPSPSQGNRSAYVPPWTPPTQHSQAERDAWLQEEDNDIFENVASSQNVPAAYEQYQKYGTVDTKIVGVRFYTGFATVGERITIKREPSNPYDPNASKSSRYNLLQVVY